MKVDKERADIGFEPVKVSITIESKEELKYLWNLFNTSEAVVIKNSKMDGNKYPLSLSMGEYGSLEIYHLLNKLLNERN